MKTTTRIGLIALLTLLSVSLVSCGQKGPLKRPDQNFQAQII